MLQLRKCVILQVLGLVVCIPCAAAFGSQTDRYVFSSSQSGLAQTGGIAGVFITYRIEGQFVLSIDPNMGTTSFVRVDANAVANGAIQHTQDPNEVFAMTSLAGTVLNETTLQFTGTASDGSSVRIAVTLAGSSAHLVATTTPPPSSADFFSFTMNAIAQRRYAGGTGEQGTPYQIATAADLMTLGDTPADYDKHFLLTADIDLDPNLPGGKVFDRAVIAPDATNAAGTEYSFDGLPFTGVFDGNSQVIRNLTITGGKYLGLFGQVGAAATVRNLGIVGANMSSSGNRVGGLAGCNIGMVAHCHVTGAIRSAGSDIGGLAGINHRGIVTQCYSTGIVSGNSSVGGLVGYNISGSINQCYNASDVDGVRSVGGLLGYNALFNSSIHQCYSTGAVHGSTYVGGLVGDNSTGGITHCYSAGAVSGDSYVGGLVGGCFAGTRTSFWDVNTSGQAISVGGGTGLTTTEMKTASTFRVWTDCSGPPVWTIDEGKDYPRLWWEHRPGNPVTRLCDVLSGTGTSKDPFVIYTAEELNTIALYPGEWNKHFLLMADIDLSGFDGKDGRPSFNVIAPNLGAQYPGGRNPPTLISFPGTPFTGVFDGNGHQIRHLTVESGRGGLFGGLGTGAEVRNLGIVDGNMSGSVPGLGGLAGWNAGMVSHCYNSGVVRGYYCVGGLVGMNNDGTVIDCHNTSTVYGDSDVGGLVGYGWNGIVAQCYSTGAVSGKSVVGGLMGNDKGCAVTQCYSTGPVSGTFDTGGLIGLQSLGTFVISCFWDIQTSGLTWSISGTGKSTADMQKAETYLAAGWDFVGEIANGTAEIWQTPEQGGYPMLATFSGYPPVLMEGSGTADAPYVITNALQLGAMVHYSARAHYRLATSIDLSGIHWDRAVIPWFAGTFDGGGHTVSHLTVQGSAHVGLFGLLGTGSRVSNLAVTDANIIGSYRSVGALAGHTSGTVTQCGSGGRVSGGSSVGGLVGILWSGAQVTDCYSTCATTGTYYVGGLTAANYGIMTRCYSMGRVSGVDNVGGLDGLNSPDSSAVSCFWNVETSGQSKSADGVGKATVELRAAKTFTDAGWDFVGETANGTEDIWWIEEGKDYPRLWWEAR